MICIRCGAKIDDETHAQYCPRCGAPLNNQPGVSDDTKVSQANPGKPSGETKVFRASAASNTTGAAGTKMKTDPQVEFTKEDFEKFSHFDMYGGDPYGIEIPGRENTTQKQSAVGGDPTVVLPPSQEEQKKRVEQERKERERIERERLERDAAIHEERVKEEKRIEERKKEAQRQRQAQEAQKKKQEEEQQPEEKYFPNGFLQDDTVYVQKKKKRHKVGVLDILVLLIGIVAVWLCATTFTAEGGFDMVWQFMDSDLALLIDSMTDITYFTENPDVVQRIFTELSLLTLLTMILAAILIMVCCFLKNIVLMVVRGVVLLLTGVGMLFIGLGYSISYQETVSETYMSSSMAVLVLTGAAALAAILCLVYLWNWGFTSFFTRFTGRRMASLTVNFILALVLLIFHQLMTDQLCGEAMGEEVLRDLLEPTQMAVFFLVFCFIASIEDRRAKRG